MMERTSICAACAYYGVQPIALSVDPACRSNVEVDRLCVPHRARATEGFCVLCGRLEPWVSPWEKSEVGACERCYRGLFGAELADDVAAELAAAFRGPEGNADQLPGSPESRSRREAPGSCRFSSDPRRKA